MINEYKTIVTKTFSDELENIIYYIKEILKEPSIAKNVYRKITKAIYKLSYFPTKNSILKSPENEDLFISKLNNYIIIYLIDFNQNEVFILHIFHTTQDYFNKL